MSHVARFVAVLIGDTPALLCGAVTGVAEDRHGGYYYPKPPSQKNYRARSRGLGPISRQRITLSRSTPVDEAR